MFVAGEEQLVALQRTGDEWWVVYRDEAGEEVRVLADQGAVRRFILDVTNASVTGLVAMGVELDGMVGPELRKHTDGFQYRVVFHPVGDGICPGPREWIVP